MSHICETEERNSGAGEGLRASARKGDVAVDNFSRRFGKIAANFAKLIRKSQKSSNKFQKKYKSKSGSLKKISKSCQNGMILAEI